MVRLTRRVVRECCQTTDRGRPLVVALLPGDVIYIHRKGARVGYRLRVGRAYYAAASDLAAVARRLPGRQVEVPAGACHGHIRRGVWVG
jgi:hypothetical protein